MCAHLRPGRLKTRSRYMMQPLSGLHVASLIDPAAFSVDLHHEDWHGPYDTTKPGDYDIVFLTGLQVDFDRMRQLSYFFRRAGSTVVAGGSVCTNFPEFAATFFDAVCVGGVEAVTDVIRDYLQGTLRTIYRTADQKLSKFPVRYQIFARSGINPVAHLVESSRGCSFRCSFCVIPSELGAHRPFDRSAIVDAIDDSIRNSPRLSFRRLYPLVLFHDNNMSDDRSHLLWLCETMRRHPRVRGWAALVTQNVLRDRELVRLLSRSKCVSLFVGLESFDRALLKRYRKTQNLGSQNIIEDIEFAERSGIGIGYGYLFDPRHQSAALMRTQIEEIAQNPHMPMPIYMSVIAPLAGTEAFWDDLESRRLAPDLRLRDLDGETIAYRNLADSSAALVDFVERIFRRPWEIVGRRLILLKTLRRVARAGTLNPIRWYLIAAANLHCFVWSRATKASPRTYLAGTDTLDPQYFEHPDDLTEADRRRYFEPVKLTDETGAPAGWLAPYFEAHLLDTANRKDFNSRKKDKSHELRVDARLP